MLVVLKKFTNGKVSPGLKPDIAIKCINCAKGKRLKAVENVVLPPSCQAKIDVCKVTEIYQNEARNKPAISMTVRRAHFEDENKSPDWPGQS